MEKQPRRSTGLCLLTQDNLSSLFSESPLTILIEVEPEGLCESGMMSEALRAAVRARGVRCGEGEREER